MRVELILRVDACSCAFSYQLPDDPQLRPRHMISPIDMIGAAADEGLRRLLAELCVQRPDLERDRASGE